MQSQTVSGFGIGVVRPEEAGRNVAVMEAAARSIAAHGRPVPLDV